jgi:peptide/nickel transport system ATP-binding protein
MSSPNGDARHNGPLLSVTDLTVEFLSDRGWSTVVDHVSFTVDRAEIVGLVGESGSGKTVTSKAVMGLVPTPPGRMVAGSVVLDGVELSALARRDLEDVRGDAIAMIFQEPMSSLNPAYTVGEQIAETIRRHRGASRSSAWDAAVKALARVEIPQPAVRARSYPHELSGGMCQRAIIAMALSCGPKLVIADEPTTALDVTIQAQILHLLREICNEAGTAILYISHDLGVVAEICDRVVVMYAGQVVEQASTLDLFRSPTHPYTEGLLRSLPSVAARGQALYSIHGQPPLPGTMPPGCRFHPRCPYAEGRCASAPVELAHLGTGQQSRCLRSSELALGPAEFNG